MSQARVQASQGPKRKSLRGGPRNYLAPKLALIALVFALSAWSREQTRPIIPAKGRVAFYQGLERHLPGAASVRGVAWAPSTGLLGDYLWGRGVLFLGMDETRAPPLSTLYVTCARVLWDGRVLDLTAPLELLRKSGSESYLLASGAQAAWLTLSGAERSMREVQLTRLRFPAPIAVCALGRTALRAERWLAWLDGREINLPDWLVQSASLPPTTGSMTIAFKGESLFVQLEGVEATISAGENLARALGEQIGDAPVGSAARAGQKAPRLQNREPVVREHRELGAASVELVSIEAQRFQWRIVPSDREPAAQASAIQTPDTPEPKVAFSLGRATEVTRFGLASGGLVYLPPRASYATLTLSPTEGLAFLGPGVRKEVGKNDELVQLPLLIKDGAIADNARSHGGNRYRGGFCLDGRGLMLLAFVRHDTSFPIARLLAESGCEWAFDLDRGSQHPARMWIEEGQGGFELERDQTWIIGSSD